MDIFIFLAKQLEAVQAYNLLTYVFITQSDLDKPTIYKQAIDSPQANK